MSSSVSRNTRSLDQTQLFFLLGVSFQLVLGDFVARLSSAGYSDLRPVHGLAFQALLSGCTTSSELGERIGVTKQAAGQMVDYLEDAGYVERLDHPEGGRRKLVVLTEKGSIHVGVAGRLLSEFESELATKVGDPGLSRTRESLIALIEHLADGPVPPLRPIW